MTTNYHKQLRDRRNSLGLCVCGKRPLAHGRKQCEECLARRNNRNAQTRNNGLCQCGRARKAGFMKCVKCLADAASRRLLFKRKGFCDCGTLSTGDAITCRFCTTRKTVRRQNNVVAGLCHCGKKPILGKKSCGGCAILRRNNYLMRCVTEPKFVATKKVRGVISEALKRQHGTTAKTNRTEILLGCTIEFARRHLEKQFLPGMSWNNVALWHIDHYIPCAAFNLVDERQQRLCNNWRNLRPLWVKDNLLKKDRLPCDYATRLAELEKYVI